MPVLFGRQWTPQEDLVRNDGFRPAPHMMLYHCNLGFPVVSPDSELIVGAGSVRARELEIGALPSAAAIRAFEQAPT